MGTDSPQFKMEPQKYFQGVSSLHPEAIKWLGYCQSSVGWTGPYSPRPADSVGTAHASATQVRGAGA